MDNLDWKAIANYEEDSFTFVAFNKSPCKKVFCDHEIDDHKELVSETLEAWRPILTDSRWKSSKRIDVSHLINPDLIEEGRQVEMWESAVGKLMKMQSTDGSFMCVVTKTNFFVIGNQQNHPYFATLEFEFDNSDGSTISYDVSDLNPDNLERLISDAQNYLFNQRH